MTRGRCKRTLGTRIFPPRRHYIRSFPATIKAPLTRVSDSASFAQLLATLSHRRSPLRRQIFAQLVVAVLDSPNRFDECTRPKGGLLVVFFCSLAAMAANACRHA